MRQLWGARHWGPRPFPIAVLVMLSVLTGGGGVLSLEGTQGAANVIFS